MIQVIISGLTKLATDNTSWEEDGVSVSEESGWVGLNLSNLEARAGINRWV